MSTTETTFDKLSEKDLRRALADAKATIAEVDSASSDDVRAHGDELLARYETAISTTKEARYELRQRDGQRRSLKSRILHTQDPLAWALQTAALRLGGGVQLVPSRLAEDQAAEIRDLTSRWPDLTDQERLRAEHLVGTAAGNPTVFEDRRCREQIRALAADARRLPETGSIVAAVIADTDLLSMVSTAMREAIEVNDFGTPIVMTSREPILEPEDVGVLYIALSAIGANGGHPVSVNEAGSIGRPAHLPRLDLARVVHLRRNGWLSVVAESGVRLVGYGERSREIAAKWGIKIETTKHAEPRKS